MPFKRYKTIIHLKNEEVFANLQESFHSLSSTLTKNKQKKTINTGFISSHVWLKKQCHQISRMCLHFTFTGKYIRGWEINATASEEELKFADTDL